VDGHDVRVLELPGDARLAQEAPGRVAVGELAQQLLEGDLAAQERVEGDEIRPMPPRALSSRTS
jgi:hypothetical protein